MKVRASLQSAVQFAAPERLVPWLRFATSLGLALGTLGLLLFLVAATYPRMMALFRGGRA